MSLVRGGWTGAPHPPVSSWGRLYLFLPGESTGPTAVDLAGNTGAGDFRSSFGLAAIRSCPGSVHRNHLFASRAQPSAALGTRVRLHGFGMALFFSGRGPGCPITEGTGGTGETERSVSCLFLRRPMDPLSLKSLQSLASIQSLLPPHQPSPYSRPPPVFCRRSTCPVVPGFHTAEMCARRFAVCTICLVRSSVSSLRCQGVSPSSM